MKSDEYIKKEADKASINVVSEPFSDFKRGFKYGFPVGYRKGYEDRKNEKRMSDEQLAEKFDKVVRQPNLIVADVGELVRIAKEYADGIK